MESEQERGRRHRQRAVFDDIAAGYDASRLGYPEEIAAFVLLTAGIGPGSDVLEVGCGTGQLTRELAGREFRITAIDIGPSMIAAARRRLSGAGITFVVTSFEDLTAADASFDLVISGAAYHWVDPEVRFAKAARLLRPGGWLALLGYDERYDEPLGSALTGMWAARSDPAAPWTGPRTGPGTDTGTGQGTGPPEPDDAGAIDASGLFCPPVTKTASHRLMLPPASVLGIEGTRSTLLSWPPEAREQFLAELRAQIGDLAEVPLTRVSWVTMAQPKARI
ncbi:MAG TPA: class I SAM-dependent methyltransferase [Streptosporangiaceae bacterium]